MMIYFIERASDQLVKIGVTGNLKLRMYSLRSQHGDLEVLGWMEGDRTLEKELHHRFSRLRMDGEWFRPDERLFIFIENNCHCENPEATLAKYKNEMKKAQEEFHFWRSECLKLYGYIPFGDETKADLVLKVNMLIRRLQDNYMNIMFLRQNEVERKADSAGREVMRTRQW